MKKLSTLILFIFTLIFFLFPPKTALADILFYDDFESGNFSKWEIVRGNWTIQDIQGSKRAGSNVASYSDYEIQAGSFDWSDYEFSVDVLPISGANKNIFFRVQNQRSLVLPGHNLPVAYGLHLVNNPNLLELQKWTTESGQLLVSVPANFPFNIVTKITIWVKGTEIKIFIGNSNSPAIQYIDNNSPLLNGRIALAIITGASSSEVWYDNVLVTDLAATPTPNPLIFLPGLGGSWNYQEIFLGIDQPQNAWYKTPFRDDYDGLIKTLQNAGYTLDQNLFVFYYDWLQPINQSAGDLKNYIDTVVNPPPGTKVDLLGHSLGGLVGRTYIQNNPGTHEVNKLITAGSPHKGAPQVYKAWEGADLTGLLGDKERIGVGIILRLRGFGYPNLVQAIQNLVPSLGNLLFIDNYLKWNEGGVEKPESSLTQQNIWLKNLSPTPSLLDLSSTIVGLAGDTSRWLRIVERSPVDILFGRWEDGKPITEEYAPGDKTVLEESAKLNNANIVNMPGLDHGDLVTSSTGIAKILELLGVTASTIITTPKTSFEPALVFALASSATFKVTDPLGQEFLPGPENILIFSPASSGNYKIKVNPEGQGGNYQFLVGQLTQKNDIWSQYTDSIKPGETDSYIIPIDNSLKTTDSYLAKLINKKFEKLVKQIDEQPLNLKSKVKIKSQVFKAWAKFKPVPVLLQLNKDTLANKFVVKTINEEVNLNTLLEGLNQKTLLLSSREILEYLSQLHSLLEK